MVVSAFLQAIFPSLSRARVPENRKGFLGFKIGRLATTDQEGCDFFLLLRPPHAWPATICKSAGGRFKDPQVERRRAARYQERFRRLP